MWLLSSTILLLFQSLQQLEGASTTSLTLLASTSCICPGRQLVYECTVVGPTIQYTVWRGSALDCNSGISLRHGLFMETGYANGTCNDGAIMARITSNTGGCYTSQLIINASWNFNSESIQCFFDDGTSETLIDTSTIRIISASFPPPNDVRLADVQPGQITFNWTSVDALCDSLSYNIISSNCGQCLLTTTNTTATCTGVVASGQVCTFIVQTVVCGIIGILSHPTTVILKAPRVPNIQSVPSYDHTTGSLLSITSSFDALDSLIISDGFKNDIVSYSVSYLDSTTSNICSQVATIPVSACQDRVCKHRFHVSTTFCHPMTNITVIVTTTSLLGQGLPSNPLIIDSINRLFDVDTVFSTNTLRITCSFLSPTPAKYKRSCTVLLGSKQEPSCDQLTQPLKNEYTVRANRSLVSVDLPIFPTENVSQTMCFVVIASDGVLIAEAKGMLMVIAGCDANQLGDIDETELSSVNCGLPLFTASIKDGLVCYTGTGIGAVATHHCFNCGFMKSSAHTVRTCLPNGTWNGTVPHCDCDSTCVHVTNGIMYTAISMAVAIILITSILIIVTVLLTRSRHKVQRMLMERKAKENMQIYEDIDLTQIIDSMKNVAYESPSQAQLHHSRS